MLAGSSVAAKLLGAPPVMLDSRTKADSTKERGLILHLQSVVDRRREVVKRLSICSLRRSAGSTMRKIGKFSGAPVRPYAVLISPFCGVPPRRAAIRSLTEYPSCP